MNLTPRQVEQFRTLPVRLWRRATFTPHAIKAWRIEAETVRAAALAAGKSRHPSRRSSCRKSNRGVNDGQRGGGIVAGHHKCKGTVRQPNGQVKGAPRSVLVSAGSPVTFQQSPTTTRNVSQ